MGWTGLDGVLNGVAACSLILFRAAFGWRGGKSQADDDVDDAERQ